MTDTYEIYQFLYNHSQNHPPQPLPTLIITPDQYLIDA